MRANNSLAPARASRFMRTLGETGRFTGIALWDELGALQIVVLCLVAFLPLLLILVH